MEVETFVIVVAVCFLVVGVVEVAASIIINERRKK